MATASKPKHKCPSCGAVYAGAAETCVKCAPTAATKRVADAVRERIKSGRTHDGPVCPYCKFELDWENLGTTETEVTIYVREKIFFCPQCRSFLGVSSWHTEG